MNVVYLLLYANGILATHPHVFIDCKFEYLIEW